MAEQIDDQKNWKQFQKKDFERLRQKIRRETGIVVQEAGTGGVGLSLRECSGAGVPDQMIGISFAAWPPGRRGRSKTSEPFSRVLPSGLKIALCAIPARCRANRRVVPITPAHTARFCLKSIEEASSKYFVGHDTSPML